MASMQTTTLRYAVEHRPGCSEWLASTQTLFNRVAAFYFEVVQAHPGVLALSAQDALTELERLTHATAGHPAPVMPLADISEHVPAMFRRAAIHAALGAAHAFQSHLDCWQHLKERAVAKGKAFRLRPPVPPRQWNRALVLYGGQYGAMWRQHTNGRMTLKLWDGQTWRWVRFRLFGRTIPEGCATASPQLIRHQGRWWLHLPIERPILRPATAKTQITTNSAVRLCAVDLNLNDALAVCTLQSADGTVLATRFIRGGRELHGRRKCALGRIARRWRQTGLLAEGERDNVMLWAKVRHLDEDAAHWVSRRIVDFAQAQGASILVFEHLGSFRPEKGTYSRRSNAKRSYWLRGKIVHYSRYKAWAQGIVTCRVSPYNTSRNCS